GPKSGVCPSGERETRMTHWKSPPLVGIFGASPHVGRKRECVVVDAPPIEPVSLPAFLGNAGRFSQNAGRRKSQSFCNPRDLNSLERCLPTQSEQGGAGRTIFP